MKEEKIIKLVQSLSKKLKDKNGKVEDCTWHESYAEQAQICDDVSVHAMKNKFPERMMKTRAPNETDVELKYRKDNFESITMPYWYRAVSSVNGRIWTEQNYRITFSDEEIQKYFLEKYPIHKSVIEYFRSIVTPYKINDPNGVLCLKIGELPEIVDEATGESMFDQSGQIETALQIYGCKNVIEFEIDEYCLVLSDEKSIIQYFDKPVKEGIVFLLYDTENIYKISQTGKKIDWNFEVAVLYNHALSYLPCWKLKGIPVSTIKDTCNDLVYYSYFTPAIPMLNKALKQDSTLDASISKTAFPVRTYYEDECDEPTCNGGKIPDEYGEGGTVTKYKTCSKCGGTGKGGVRFSPLKDYVQRPPKKNITDEEMPLPFPAFAYVSPDTAILEFLKEKIRAEIIEAFTFVNIDISNSDVKGTDTALGKQIDREELFSFLKQISSEVFDLFYLSVKSMIAVRYGVDEVLEVKPPKTFEIYNADELTVELGEAKKAGVPEIAIREMTKDYMSQRFSQQGELPKIIEVVFKVDGYATKDTTEIAILKSNNLISLWQAVLHEEIYQFVDQLSGANKDFFEWDLAKQKTELENLAKARATELTPNSAAAIVDSIARGGGIGKIPLALQQLALARTRAEESGDLVLAKTIGNKMDELLNEI